MNAIETRPLADDTHPARIRYTLNCLIVAYSPQPLAAREREIVRIGMSIMPEGFISNMVLKFGFGAR
jgi:hypothetical protein